jgi:DNA-binding FrmR family transcriptional regulator
MMSSIKECVPVHASYCVFVVDPARLTSVAGCFESPHVANSSSNREKNMSKNSAKRIVRAHEDECARKAVAVDPDIKAANLTRLRRIEGQVRGIHEMVERDSYCTDVLRQVSAVQQALRAVGRELIRNHVRHCATKAIHAGGADADAMYDELVDLFHKNSG